MFPGGIWTTRRLRAFRGLGEYYWGLYPDRSVSFGITRRHQGDSKDNIVRWSVPRSPPYSMALWPNQSYPSTKSFPNNCNINLNPDHCPRRPGFILRVIFAKKKMTMARGTRCAGN